jgi:hypothetical protein
MLYLKIIYATSNNTGKHKVLCKFTGKCHLAVVGAVHTVGGYAHIVSGMMDQRAVIPTVNDVVNTSVVMHLCHPYSRQRGPVKRACDRARWSRRQARCNLSPKLRINPLVPTGLQISEPNYLQKKNVPKRKLGTDDRQCKSIDFFSYWHREKTGKGTVR